MNLTIIWEIKRIVQTIWRRVVGSVLINIPPSNIVLHMLLLERFCKKYQASFGHCEQELNVGTVNPIIYFIPLALQVTSQPLPWVPVRNAKSTSARTWTLSSFSPAAVSRRAMNPSASTWPSRWPCGTARTRLSSNPCQKRTLVWTSTVSRVARTCLRASRCTPRRSVPSSRSS